MSTSVVNRRHMSWIPREPQRKRRVHGFQLFASAKNPSVSCSHLPPGDDKELSGNEAVPRLGRLLGGHVDLKSNPGGK